MHEKLTNNVTIRTLTMGRKTVNWAVAIATAVLATSGLQAEETGAYAKLNASAVTWNGGNGLGSALGTGWGISGVGGLKLHKNFGIEAEVGVTQNDILGVTLTTVPILANAVVFVPVGDSVEFSLGGGIGYGVINISAGGTSYANLDGMAGQLKGGVSAKLSESISIDAQYAIRFLFEDTSLSQNIFSVGLGVKF